MPPGLPLTRDRARLLGLVVAGIVLATILARSPLRDPRGGQAHLALAQELVACVGAALAAFAAARTRAPLARDAIARVVLALLALEVVSGALAANPWASLRASAIVLAGAVVFFVSRATTEVPAAPVLVAALVSTSVVLEALGVSVGWSRTGHAPGGVLGERNAASELLVCVLPWVTAIVVRAERRAVRAASAAAIALSITAIVLTRTRSAWLALAALAVLGLGLALRADCPARRSRAAIVLFAAALGVVVAVRLPTRLAWTTQRPYRDTLVHLVDRATPSAAGRLVQGQTTLRMARAHPVFGVGPGNWADRYLAFAREGDPTVRPGPAPTTRVPSSDVLGWVAERGLVAAALVAALAWMLSRRRPPEEDGEAGGRDDPWLRRATLLAVLVVGTFDAVLQLAPHLVLVAWILGTASPATRSPRVAARPSAWFATFGAVALACAPFAAARIGAFVLATSPRGLDDLERAARLDPGNVPLRLHVAETFAEAGDCARARVHLDAAARLAAPSPAYRALAARCL